MMGLKVTVDTDAYFGVRQYNEALRFRKMGQWVDVFLPVCAGSADYYPNDKLTWSIKEIYSEGDIAMSDEIWLRPGQNLFHHRRKRSVCGEPTT
jgi:hypothetical protein